MDKNLPQSKHLGALNTDAARTISEEQKNRKQTKDELRVAKAESEKPPVSRILSLAEMEVSNT